MSANVEAKKQVVEEIKNKISNAFNVLKCMEMSSSLINVYLKLEVCSRTGSTY